MISVPAGRAPDHFTSPEDRQAIMRAVSNNGAMEFLDLGVSEEGREIGGVRFGRGSKRVTLIAGSHADEPVGPETLVRFIQQASAQPDEFARAAEEFTILIIPHVNPDGEARNWSWIERWPDLAAYMTSAARELPGKDIEFGYPDLRAENRLVASAMREMAPISLHMSLHGMGYSDGVMLLVDRFWAFRAGILREGFSAEAATRGLRLHDHNRRGEKGFFQIEPGFTTTPEGAAMRAYFHSTGQPEVASLFRDSSMEFARSLGGDPLCVVTELPLFLVDGPAEPGVPVGFLDFRKRKPALVARLSRGESADSVLAAEPVSHLHLATAIEIQWESINLSLQTVLASK
jgi:Zinc carboxypeptidase